MRTESLAYNLASESLETKRIPDPYTYKLNKAGKLAVVETGDEVEAYTECVTSLGKMELAGLLNLQDWFIRTNAGTSIWISMPYPNIYKETKIIVSEIIGKDSAKVLFNRAIVLDGLAPEDAINFAKDITANELTSTELRTMPIQVPNGRNWLEVLGNYMDTQFISSYIGCGADIEEKQKAIEIARTIVELSNQSPEHNLEDVLSWKEYQSFRGTNNLRCALRSQTPFQLAFDKAAKIGSVDKLCCTCPFCGKEVTAEIYDGRIHCPSPPNGCGRSAEYGSAA